MHSVFADSEQRSQVTAPKAFPFHLADQHHLVRLEFAGCHVSASVIVTASW